jgi:hypothetical protein
MPIQLVSKCAINTLIFVTSDILLHVTDMNKEINISLNTTYIHRCADITDTQ